MQITATSTLSVSPVVCWVQVHAIEGSTPREVGASMLVWPQHIEGSIGGGHVEWDVMARARQWLLQAANSPINEASPDQAAGVRFIRYPLGPTLGQCCGGVMQLRLELVAAPDVAALRARLQPVRYPVAVFGAGHVGQALVRVLAPLPFTVTWLDSRDALTGASDPRAFEQVDPLQDAVPDLPPDSRVLIMSHNHAHDLEVLAACLHRQRQRSDVAWIGLIGSRTKWARFQHRLRERGFTEAEMAQVTCPIGVPGITGKAPEVIAVAVAAQLLQGLSAQHRDALANGPPN
jgi:xanthine dehydrogenase accessory factor